MLSSVSLTRFMPSREEWERRLSRRREKGQLIRRRNVPGNESNPEWVEQQLTAARAKRAREKQRPPRVKTRRPPIFTCAADEARWLRKKKARDAVNYAIRSGKMHKGACKYCGCSDVEAHHLNYNQPLNVVWLCKEHHDMHTHGKEGRVKNYDTKG